MMAECESRTRQTGVHYSLSQLLNDFGWRLAPVAPAVEHALRIRRSGGLPRDGG